MIIGLAGMLLGAVDPLEGSLLVLPATALVALGAGVGRTRQRRLLYVALGLVAFGVGALWVLSALGDRWQHRAVVLVGSAAGALPGGLADGSDWCGPRLDQA